ncbi:MAG: LecA/PA-IL family lectin [Acidobacteriota bacterium]
MTFRSITTRLGILLVLILAFSLAGFADTIRLKDGSIIKGRIVGFTGGKFTVSIGDGSRLKHMTFTADEVESITFDTPADRPQFTATTRVSGPDAGGSANPVESNPPKVIVTDQTPHPNSPVVTTVSNVPRRPSSASTKSAPIAWDVKVLADNTNNGWTNSGWVLKKGQKIRITGGGTISLGKGKTSPAAGLGDLPDEQKLLKNVPTGALIAVIGDDNNDFIYVGSEREFTATRDGALFLGINEGFLDDNSGAFDVKVEILPDQGE